MLKSTPIGACTGSRAWLALVTAFMTVCTSASAADPKVPPAVEPGTRTPIAILTSGFDYTRPEIAARLARDGEGEIIAWDVPGEDRFPYDTAGDTELMSVLAKSLSSQAPISLLPVRVDPNDPVSLAKGLSFVARTPARTVLIPMWSSSRETWSVFAQAAGHHKELQLIVRACVDLPPEGAAPVFPRDLSLPSAGQQTPSASHEAATLKDYVQNLPCSPP
jgi:hypothetical protein